MTPRLDILRCKSYEELKTNLSAALEKYTDLLPKARDARILLKPNLNSNMSALTGNTTDLRILSVVIQFLQAKGYKNILIGEGTNSGFYRNKIGVISRLAVDRLVQHFGIAVKDLNYAEPYEIEFENGVKAQVAKDCIDADLFINMPKLKTHFEIGMSVCLKNLMGCLVGQPNKKKTHEDLAGNILNINKAVKPHLHIVDGLIAMEGLGPTRGTPVRMDLVLVGTDPYLIDLVCAKLADFDYRKVRTLARAEEQKLLTPEHHKFADSLDLQELRRSFKPPTAGPLATFIHSPKRQKYFLKIRNTKFFTYLASTRWFGHLLFLTGLRQDVFLFEEMNCDGLSLNESSCDQCGFCKGVCPLGFGLPDHLKKTDRKCIHCLYCYSVCPRHAIQFKGQFGFFKEQLKQYDHLIRGLFNK
jgi:uncharacterized protein (DUF362 family)/ferredoxin